MFSVLLPSILTSAVKLISTEGLTCVGKKLMEARGSLENIMLAEPDVVWDSDNQIIPGMSGETFVSNTI